MIREDEVVWVWELFEDCWGQMATGKVTNLKTYLFSFTLLALLIVPVRVEATRIYTTSSFCHNNPAQYYDPDGRNPVAVAAIAAAIVGWFSGAEYAVAPATPADLRNADYGAGQGLANTAISITAQVGVGAAINGACGLVSRNVLSRTTGRSPTTALSPYRYTRAGETFQHYSFAEHADSLVGGLRPASYGTPAGGLSGVGAQQGLALRHATPPNAAYTISPPAGTPIRVNPNTLPQFGQPDGLPEVEFILGTPPGSVSGPILIPRGRP